MKTVRQDGDIGCRVAGYRKTYRQRQSTFFSIISFVLTFRIRLLKYLLGAVFLELTKTYLFISM